MKCAFCLLLVLPSMSQQGANVYSMEKERALGQQYAAEIRRQSKPLDNPEVEAYVRRIGEKLVAQLKDPRFEYRFETITDNSWTEPLSLPGGYVFIPAGAFVAAQDEAEFAGMLAHSIGHVALRHGRRPTVQGQITNRASVPLVFMGGWNGLHADSRREQTSMPAGFLEFQRTYELEADSFGVELAARAGYDPAAFERYIDRTQSADTNPSPLPERELRLARLQEMVASLPSSSPSSDDQEFRRIQEITRSTRTVTPRLDSPPRRGGRE